MFKVRSLSFIIFSLLVCSQASAMKKIIPVFKNLNKRAFTQLTKNSSLKKALLVGGGTVGLGIGSKYAYDYIEEENPNIFKWSKEQFDVSFKNKDKETILMEACLMQACSFQFRSSTDLEAELKEISYLLSLDKIDPNIKDKNGSTPLLLALDAYFYCVESHLHKEKQIYYEIVELLLKQPKTNVNLLYKTLYKYRVCAPEYAIGYKIKRKRVFWSALTLAFSKHNEKMISLLLTRDDIDVQSARETYKKS